MAKRFSKYIRTADPTKPYLPLMHTTEGLRFQSIVEDETLQPQHCKVFDEKLLYFFYGRPAYRPRSDKATSLFAYKPVCLLFETDVIENTHRIFPFDSGAFKSELYEDYIHPDMELVDFNVSSDLEDAAKIVTKFFGSNKAYMDGKPLTDLTIAASDMQVQSYVAMISNQGNTPMDDRRGSIEVQCKNTVSISQNNILAVACPSPFLDDPIFQETILKKWKAEPLTYPSYHASPKEDIRAICGLVQGYLERYKYI